MLKYRIFPAIGFARLGEDTSFFIGPEVPGGPPGELLTNGTLGPVAQFKDATRTKIRKQGARFHLFESSDGVAWQPAQLPEPATVTWTVTLDNKKSGVRRSGSPPIAPTRPQEAAELQSMIIRGGTRQVSGPNAASAPFEGPFVTTAANGDPFSVDVELGRLATDSAGRLIVLGGNGFSSGSCCGCRRTWF